MGGPPIGGFGGGMPPPPTMMGSAGPPGAGMMPPPPGGMGGMGGFSSPPVQNPLIPSGFDSSQNLQGMGQGAGYPPNAQGQGPLIPGAPGPLPQPGSTSGAETAVPAVSTGAPLPLIEEMDLSIQCSPTFMRCTVSKLVGNQAKAAAARIPLGLVVKPMAGDRGVGNDEIQVVDFGSTGIVRCKRCRTYINPFVTWADNGRRWRCNICGMLNDVPSNYFSHLDNNGQRRDKGQRPELSNASVEFVAPGDYMVRPPQPPVYFFVVDVSEASIASGMINCMVNAIKESLDNLPGSVRTQIGFITFDSCIHFYNLKSSLNSPQMLVVSDVNDVILPLPEDLLVNLHESRAVVECLLDSLPSMFSASKVTGGGAPMGVSCTGPALMAAKRVIQHLGGKLCLFQSCLPSLGEGALKMRENPRLIGTEKEHTLLNAEDPWYKTNAIDFSRLQVAVDTFLFSSQYTDLATLSVLSRYTAGQCYYYPGFNQARDGKKFQTDLMHDLTRSTAFESVMRVRATRGMRFSNFYGNYYVRGTDLLALPNCTSDSSFSLDMSYDEAQLQAQAVSIQSALLYTSSNGERRIRVHTMVLPVTSSVSEMVESLDIDCAMNLLSKQAVGIAAKAGMDIARQRVHQTTVEMLRASKQGAAQQPGAGYNQQIAVNPNAPVPNSLLLLPLYSMSLQKSLVLRGGSDVRIDERAFFQLLLHNMDIEESKVFIYPRMFSIHDMDSDIGLACDNADEDAPTAGPLQVRLPSILNLSYERLVSEGIFLLENGCDMFLWIGRSVNPAILETLFNNQSLEGVDTSSLSIDPDNSDFSSRVTAVIEALRSERPARYMQLHFIKEGDGYAEAFFARFLIEDRANFSGANLSYTEYHSHITRAVSGLPS
jgi:protein transport protein SEC24